MCLLSRSSSHHLPGRSGAGLLVSHYKDLGPDRRDLSCKVTAECADVTWSPGGGGTGQDSANALATAAVVRNCHLS